DQSATSRLSRSGHLPAHDQRQDRSRRRSESDEIDPLPRTGRECGDDIVHLEISTRREPPRSPGRISSDWLEPRSALAAENRRQGREIDLSKLDTESLTLASPWKIRLSR